MKALRDIIRHKYHNLWDVVYAVKCRLIWMVPVLHPQIFKTLKKLSTEKLDNIQIDGKRVLFFAVRQDRVHIAWKFIIAQALKLRGNQVDYVGCDGLIRNSCNERWYPGLNKNVCQSCSSYAKQFYEQAKFNVDWLSNYSDHNDISEANKQLDNLHFNDYRSFTYNGLPIGELVRPSVCHFTRTENIEAHGKNDYVIRNIYKNFLIGSIIMTKVCNRILDKYTPDIIVMINGLFMSERVMLELSKIRTIKSIVIESGLRPDTICLINDHYIDYSKVDGWEEKSSTCLTEAQEACLDRYIDSRRAGSGQTVDYWTDSLKDKDSIREQLNLKGFKKIVLLFPNITWDSALYGLDVMFHTLHEWINKTISYFEKHPSDCLIIRTHPAEKTWQGAMRDSIYTWINESYPKGLPDNIKVIAPDDPISSYSLMELADFGLVFSSTAGLEMTLLGKPVVVVGRVHFWGRGFTIDPVTEQDYYYTLDRLLGSNNVDRNDTNLTLARRYTYFIFYEASFPIKFIYTNNYRISPPELHLNTYKELLYGNDEALDVICDGIVNDKPFILQNK